MATFEVFWKLTDKDGPIYVNPRHVRWVQRLTAEGKTEIMYGDGEANRVLVQETPTEIFNTFWNGVPE